MLDNIKITLNLIFGVIKIRFCHDVCNVIMDIIDFPKNL